MLTPQGHFMYCMESFYEGLEVTNCKELNEEELLLSIQQEQQKLVIFNLDTREEKLIILPVE